MTRLAQTYWDQGCEEIEELKMQELWKKAEELEVQVMETSKRVLGAEHLDTLSSMTDLAMTYKELERQEEAEKLEAQVMETRSRLNQVIDSSQ